MRADHPDAQQIRDLMADLTAWLDIDVYDPTSQVTGGGAIRFAEHTFSNLHSGRPSVLLPSATFGMRTSLIAAGVKPGQRVLIPAVDWTATLAAVRAIGATPVLVEVDPSTMTIDPAAIRPQLDQGIAALVACHLHGVAADVPAIRNIVGRIPIIEDCAQALGSSIDGALCGTHGDLAVFSFANKTVNAGEAAIVSSANPELHHSLIELTAHPVRQILEGVANPNLSAFSARVAPVCAIQLAVALRRWDRERAVAEHNRLKARLPAAVRAVVLGHDDRRENAAPSVPLRLCAQATDAVRRASTPSTALDITTVIDGHPQNADAVLVRWTTELEAAVTGGRRAG